MWGEREKDKLKTEITSLKERAYVPGLCTSAQGQGKVQNFWGPKALFLVDAIFHMKLLNRWGKEKWVESRGAVDGGKPILHLLEPQCMPTKCTICRNDKGGLTASKITLVIWWRQWRCVQCRWSWWTLNTDKSTSKKKMECVWERTEDTTMVKIHIWNSDFSNRSCMKMSFVLNHLPLNKMGINMLGLKTGRDC